jgi:hypothetical protein
VSPATQSRQCRRCRRIGYDGFIPTGGENDIVECANDRACNRRRARRARHLADVLLDHRLPVGAACLACGRPWDDPAAHRAFVAAAL